METLKPIPGFKRYGITRCARLFNLKTKKELKTSPVRGYQKTVLVNDEGVRKTVPRHRMVALTHLPPPDDPAQTNVNHIDHTPGNDHVDNLEWVTSKENARHAASAGRMSVRSVPCESLDSSGKITRYDNVAQAATDNGVAATTMWCRVTKGDCWIWPDGKRYRLGHTDVPWSEETVYATGRSRMVLVRCLFTDQITTYSQLQYAAHLFDYTVASIGEWINKSEHAVLPGLYQMQYIDDLKPWREFEDVFDELEKHTSTTVVVRFDADWSNPVCYESARICGYHNNIGASLLDYRLKRKGQRVWSDKYRYVLYSDLTEEQKKTTRYKVLRKKDASNDYRKLQREYRRRSDTCVKSSGVTNDLSDIKASRVEPSGRLRKWNGLQRNPFKSKREAPNHFTKWG